MKATELKSETPDQLKQRVAELRKEQFNLRFQRASGQLEKTDRVRVVRRDIARIKTLLGAKTAATPSSAKKS